MADKKITELFQRESSEILAGDYVPLEKELKELTGTVSTTAASAEVAGSGTAFLTELKIGDMLTTNLDGVNEETRIVIAIASDMALSVDAEYDNTYSGVVYSGGNSKLDMSDLRKLVRQISPSYRSGHPDQNAPVGIIPFITDSPNKVWIDGSYSSDPEFPAGGWVSMFNDLGVKSNISTYNEAFGSGNNMTQEEMLQLQEDGHELMMHVPHGDGWNISYKGVIVNAMTEAQADEFLRMRMRRNKEFGFNIKHGIWYGGTTKDNESGFITAVRNHLDSCRKASGSFNLSDMSYYDIIRKPLPQYRFGSTSTDNFIYSDAKDIIDAHLEDNRIMPTFYIHPTAASWHDESYIDEDADETKNNKDEWKDISPAQDEFELSMGWAHLDKLGHSNKIVEDSEVVKVNGITLSKPADYSIDYEGKLVVLTTSTTDDVEITYDYYPENLLKRWQWFQSLMQYILDNGLMIGTISEFIDTHGNAIDIGRSQLNNSFRVAKTGEIYFNNWKSRVHWFVRNSFASTDPPTAYPHYAMSIFTVSADNPGWTFSGNIVTFMDKAGEDYRYAAQMRLWNTNTSYPTIMVRYALLDGSDWTRWFAMTKESVSWVQTSVTIPALDAGETATVFVTVTGVSANNDIVICEPTVSTGVFPGGILWSAWCRTTDSVSITFFNANSSAYGGNTRTWKFKVFRR